MSKNKEGGSHAGRAGAMRLVDKAPKVDRRGFLKGGGLASIGIAVMSGTALLSSPNEAFAKSFQALGEDAGKILLRMARDIFPHDKLAEKYYLRALEPYEAAVSKDAALKKLLLDGISLLNAGATEMHGKAYLEIARESDRVAVLQSIEASPFFQKVRGDLVTGIYDNKEVFSFFGYEGSSWEKGGYLNRGFNDIDWL